MSSLLDPLQLWRKAISTLEGSGNTLANQTMNTGDFAAALHQMASLSLGMQQTFEKVLGVYLRKLDLPSRKEIAELAVTLQRIETRLEQLDGGHGDAMAPPRPARTRLPSAASPAPATSAPTNAPQSSVRGDIRAKPPAKRGASRVAAKKRVRGQTA